MAIITVSREIGAGALPISQQAAEELGYTLVDGQAIRDAAEHYGLTAEDVELADEKPPAYLDTLDSKLLLTHHQIELIVLDMARKGNVIIHGRAGRDVLQNMDQAFRVRVVAPFDERVERLAEEEWLDPEVAHGLVRRSDLQRAGFMKYYFDRDWADPITYDLVINTSRMDTESAARMIVEGVRDPRFICDEGGLERTFDQQILRKKIQIDYLQQQHLEELSFEILVNESQVILEGNVFSEEQLLQAISSATRIASGYKVENRLRVVSHKLALPPDA